MLAVKPRLPLRVGGQVALRRVGGGRRRARVRRHRARAAAVPVVAAAAVAAVVRRPVRAVAHVVACAHNRHH